LPDAKIMADFRLSKGDGIEFKRKFVDMRERLVQLASAWSTSSNAGSAYFNHSDTSSTLTAGNNSVNQLQEAMDT